MSQRVDDQLRYLQQLPDAELIAAWRDLRRPWTRAKILAGYHELYRRGYRREAEALVAVRRKRYGNFILIAVIVMMVVCIMVGILSVALH